MPTCCPATRGRGGGPASALDPETAEIAGALPRHAVQGCDRRTFREASCVTAGGQVAGDRCGGPHGSLNQPPGAVTRNAGSAWSAWSTASW